MNNALRKLSQNAKHAQSCVVWHPAPLFCAEMCVGSVLTMLGSKQESVIRNIYKHTFI